jgi:hypothetical protein
MIILTSDLSAPHASSLPCTSLSDTEAQAFLVLRTDFQEGAAVGDHASTSTGGAS